MQTNLVLLNNRQNSGPMLLTLKENRCLLMTIHIFVSTAELGLFCKDIMEGAMLHAEILSYFTEIFEQEVSTDSLKAQLDEILNSLVSDFDDEEIPLRKEEKFNQFIIDFEGDENRARQNMNIEQTAFEEHKDFTQLLTDAAMKPESSHASVFYLNNLCYCPF